jgi:hypothetical protein
VLNDNLEKTSVVGQFKLTTAKTSSLLCAGEAVWYRLHAVFGLKKEHPKPEGSSLEELCSVALGFRASIGWF